MTNTMEAVAPKTLQQKIAEHTASFFEEVANSLTHGIGLGLSIACLALMAYWSAVNGNVWHIVSTAVFGLSMVMLYLASTMYHIFARSRWANLLETFDHCAIYLLIAGTYTPICLVTIHGAWGWAIFGTIWAMAIVGIVFKLATSVEKFQVVSTLMYLGMGWVGMIGIVPLVESMANGGLWLLLAGCLFYTLGIPFYLWRSLPFSHAIWHTFVLCGTACHFAMTFVYVIP